jgi:hypothetical protein
MSDPVAWPRASGGARYVLGTGTGTITLLPPAASCAASTAISPYPLLPGCYLKPNQRMHPPGRGRAVGSGWHHLAVNGKFRETRRALQVMRGR